MPRGCPNDCSNRGICSQGVCDCLNGLTGKDCSSSESHFSLLTPLFPLKIFQSAVVMVNIVKGNATALPSGKDLNVKFSGQNVQIQRVLAMDNASLVNVSASTALVVTAANFEYAPRITAVGMASVQMVFADVSPAGVARLVIMQRSPGLLSVELTFPTNPNKRTFRPIYPLQIPRVHSTGTVTPLKETAVAFRVSKVPPVRKGIDASSCLVVHLSPVYCLWRQHLSIQWFAIAMTVGEASIAICQLATQSACSMVSALMTPVSVIEAGPESTAILAMTKTENDGGGGLYFSSRRDKQRQQQEKADQTGWP
ncbi:hypothetical protein Aperf_G00000000682 [Anoplocephala perfoliata]